MRKVISLLVILLFCSVVSAQEETQTPYEIALERIEDAHLSGATVLSLKS